MVKYFNTLTGCLFVPVLMLVTKSGRLNAKERHTVDMRLYQYTDFWRKGNDFVDTVTAQVCRDVQTFSLAEIEKGNGGSKPNATVVDVTGRSTPTQQPADIAKTGRSPYVRPG